MKIAALLVSLMTFAQFAQADEVAYVKYCSGKNVVVNVEVYESGVVGWVVTHLQTGENETFMGFITAGDSKNLQQEFYSTDLGSDLHVNGKDSLLTQSRNGTRDYKLQCN